MFSPELPTTNELKALDRMVNVQLEDWKEEKHIHLTENHGWDD